MHWFTRLPVDGETDGLMQDAARPTLSTWHRYSVNQGRMLALRFKGTTLVLRGQRGSPACSDKCGMSMSRYVTQCNFSGFPLDGNSQLRSNKSLMAHFTLF